MDWLSSLMCFKCLSDDPDRVRQMSDWIGTAVILVLISGAVYMRLRLRGSSLSCPTCGAPARLQGTQLMCDACKQCVGVSINGKPYISL
jgi:hypothetical protein